MDGKDIRIGVFGTLRGRQFVENIQRVEGARVTAVCDQQPASLENLRQVIGDEVRRFTEFDAFIDSGLFDAVVLANYFCEHVPYAIRAMERGIHVLSETTPALTLAECVALCRTVERTGCKYMLAENYPFFTCNLEMKRLYESGKLGRALYCEGEYVHPASRKDLNLLAPGRLHWRNWLPRPYYLTHALAPLLHITGNLPVAVNCKSVFAPEALAGTARVCRDMLSILLCEMADGSLARVTGCAAWGGHGNWYRICGERGNVQNVRGSLEQVRVQYNDWQVPPGEHVCSTYDARWYEDEALNALAAGAAHGGGDFWVVYHFVRYLRDDIEPFFTVYRSVAMAAVAICALRSSQEGGREYRIPDFTQEADRQRYENDCASPFPDGDGRVSMDCCSKPFRPSPADYAQAERDWREAGLLPPLDR